MDSTQTYFADIDTAPQPIVKRFKEDAVFATGDGHEGSHSSSVSQSTKDSLNNDKKSLAELLAKGKDFLDKNKDRIQALRDRIKNKGGDYSQSTNTPAPDPDPIPEVPFYQKPTFYVPAAIIVLAGLAYVFIIRTRMAA